MNANLTYVTGHAGTGKTTRLMKMAGDLSESLISEPDFQCLLAVTHMHGARRRIDSLLHKEHPNIPVRVTTIHSFRSTW
jgi:ABC-type ATPase involved in cell division